MVPFDLINSSFIKVGRACFLHLENLKWPIWLLDTLSQASLTNLLMVIIQINEGEDIQQLTFYCQQKMLILIGWFSELPDIVLNLVTTGSLASVWYFYGGSFSILLTIDQSLSGVNSEH